LGFEVCLAYRRGYGVGTALAHDAVEGRKNLIADDQQMAPITQNIFYGGYDRAQNSLSSVTYGFSVSARWRAAQCHQCLQHSFVPLAPVAGVVESMPVPSVRFAELEPPAPVKWNAP
jgi:hypothetical protein